ncbi:MAG: thioredoxin family protein [Halanaeroarchaeum sp.]
MAAGSGEIKRVGRQLAGEPMESMEPDPDWDVDAHRDVVEAFADLDEDVVITVWGADWCPDTRDQLPEFAAALEAAGIESGRVTQVAVDREKDGEGTDEYGIEYIPSIVVERDGEELARFVEEESVPAAVHLASQFGDVDASTY